MKFAMRKKMSARDEKRRVIGLNIPFLVSDKFRTYVPITTRRMPIILIVLGYSWRKSAAKISENTGIKADKGARRDMSSILKALNVRKNATRSRTAEQVTKK